MSRKTIVAGVTPAILGEAARASLAKLDPRRLARNPVIFVTFVVAGLTTLLFLRGLVTGAPGGGGGWADHALALGHGALRELRRGRRRGPRQGAAARLRATKTEVETCRLADPSRSNQAERVASTKLRRGDVIHVEAGEIIPADGEIVERTRSPARARR
jgi:potassium-transporting ATPase ATP-binding subunit